VIDVRQSEARFLETIADRLRGKSRGILHAIETFLLDGGDQAAITDNRREAFPWYALIPRMFIV